jgi:hypothetical protein
MLALLCLNATSKKAEQRHQQVMLLEAKPWNWQQFPMSGRHHHAKQYDPIIFTYLSS